MNPNLIRYSQQQCRQENDWTRSELLFLEQVWGPAFQYDYHGLQAGFPYEVCEESHKAHQDWVQFMYNRFNLKLLIEITDCPLLSSSISQEELNKRWTAHNQLVLSGWLVLRFSADQVENEPHHCQRQIKQAIGHWWSQQSKTELQPQDADIWKLRRSLLIQMARQRNGILKPRDVADAFQMTSRAAVNWLKRFQAEGIFIGEASNHNRLTRYRLSSHA
ncbi:hypothetical protein [Paenibacillus rigui]|uniref:Uncharacterized protein n=1 Tax=Paenibacillus rigui TaxID=554312 RepID=A0A229UUV6_9BACL|nr:hypothetical protein [Paenibacillus rigui]OXM87306.1 hypothetical protein CF651_06650 [Paenibacillus rigui]